MNTLQITKALETNPITAQQFNGVYPCNKLPSKNKKNTTIIIANTDPSYKPGQHWCAFYIPKHGITEYFSSYGDYPVNKHFLKFLKKHNSSFKSNNKRLQGDFSQTCGHYCCVYLYYRCRGNTMEDFLKLFSAENFEKNDKKIMQKYRQIFKITSRKQSVKSIKQNGGSKYSQGCAPLKT